MNGFTNIVNGYSLSAIQELKTLADSIYIDDTPPVPTDDPDYITDAAGIVYYVDAVDGDDGNSGTSEGVGNAWQTTSKVSSSAFSAGDVVAFKRGQTFPGSFTISENGTSQNNIYITSYGSGARPIIGNHVEMTGTWNSIGDDKWTLSFVGAGRVWRDGVELGRVGYDSANSIQDLGEIGAFPLAGVYGWTNSNLCTYLSLDDPNGSVFTYSGITTVINLTGNFITVSGLDVRYGGNECINMAGSNITIHYNNIGLDASYGIYVDAAISDCLIERNTFDNNYGQIFDGVAEYRTNNGVGSKGVDNRGSNDAITSWSGMTNTEIRYNDFINWGHGGISMESLNGNDTVFSGNDIHHNYFGNTLDIHYCRAAVWSGQNVSNNTFHHNAIENMYTRSQLMGVGNTVSYNWFMSGKSSTYKNSELGQAILMEPYSADSTPIRDNIFEYNTFKDNGAEAFKMETYTDYETAEDTMFNTLHKNLFDNCGNVSIYATYTVGAGIYVQPYAGVHDNTYTDNAFINGIDGTPVAYGNSSKTVAEFNAFNGDKGNVITGNTETVTDQGAGIYDPNSVGVGGV